jgi:hypothetical protein
MLSSTRQHLPPDVEEARKARINAQMIELFERPCPPDTTASVQGIGLYTHVAGPPAPPPLFPHMKYLQQTSNPGFLPTGGPKEISNAGALECPVGDDVKRAWRDVKDAVNEEKRHVAFTEKNLDQLKARYGALDAPDGSAAGAGAGQPQNGRQGSIDSGSNRDVVMTGTEEQRRASATASRNEYEAARDPRLRGRQ